MTTGLIRAHITGTTYSKEFIPIAHVNEYLLLKPDDIFVKVEYIEQTGFIIHDFGKLEPFEVKKDIELDFLDAGKNGLLQLRFLLLDNFIVKMFRQPKAVLRFYLRNAKPIFTKTIQDILPEVFLQQTEFFVYQDLVPVIDIENPSNLVLNNSRIAFFGYKYYVTEVKEKPERFSIINIGGYEIKK